MEKKKSLNFIFGVIAIILGWTLYKQFDFQTLKVEHTGLAIVYFVVFVFSIYFLLKNYKKEEKNDKSKQSR